VEEIIMNNNGRKINLRLILKITVFVLSEILKGFDEEQSIKMASSVFSIDADIIKNNIL
jgi:hypothetical protein